VRKLALLLCLSLAGCAPLTDMLGGRRYVAKLATMPDFYQADRAYGSLPRNGGAYCGPTAAANAIVWLDTHGFPNLLSAATPGPTEQFELIRTLGAQEYMRTNSTKGTGPTGIMQGIRRYCAEKGYVAATEYAGWRTRNCRVAERPTIPWMLRAVRGTSSLIVNVGWYAAEDGEGAAYTRTGGHYLTVVGYERRRGATWLILHDPAKRTQKGNRNSTERCPLRCLLKPLPPGTVLRRKKDGDTFVGDGLFILDGLRLRRGIALGILDGAIAFSLTPKGE